MEIREFANVIADKCLEVLGNGYSVSAQEVVKNNGLKLIGICINKDGNNVSPNVYINGFFDRYVVNGITVDEVVSSVIDTYNKSKVSSINVGNLLDFENVKSNITVQLINTEKNAEKLAKIPHIDVLDLSYIFRVVLSSDEMGVASFTIHNEHANLWDKSASELFDIALSNSQNDEITVRGIAEILAESCSMPITDDFFIPMYVVSNENKLNGAHYIFTRSDIQKKVYDIFDESYYIIPSSLHETICVSKSECSNSEMLIDIIREVNINEVSEDEVLSDSLYFYNADTNEIEIVECGVVA